MNQSEFTEKNLRSHDDSSERSGAAYVFTRDETTWAQQTYLKASNTGYEFQFGYSVAISGNTAIVGGALESSNATGVNGGPHNDSALRSGAAYIFTSSVMAFPEITLFGNSMEITDGDASATPDDGTDFGQVNMDSETLTRTFTIANEGSALMTLSQPTLSGDAAADFSVAGNPPASIEPGVSTTFTVTFDPSAIGVRSAVVIIANDDADENPYSFALTGMGLKVVSILQTSGESSPFNEMGQFQLMFQGQTGVSYQIDYAESVFGPWMHLATISGDGATMQVTDITSQNADERFYRVSEIPQ